MGVRDFDKFADWNGGVRVARKVSRMSASSSEQPQNGAQNVKSEATAAAPPAATSCRKKKSDSESTTFFGDVLEHIDEFVSASYDEHKSCLSKTLNKVCVCLFSFHGNC